MLVREMHPCGGCLIRIVPSRLDFQTIPTFRTSGTNLDAGAFGDLPPIEKCRWVGKDYLIPIFVRDSRVFFMLA